MPSSQVSKVIDSLEKERSRALNAYYEPEVSKFESWIQLRNTDPQSIRHYAFKKRACRYIRRISNHSEELFTLCALAIPWSTLGDVRTEDDALEIIKWWGNVQHPLCLRKVLENESSRLNGCDLRGQPSKRLRTSEISPANNSPESNNDPFPFTASSNIDSETAPHTDDVTVFRDTSNTQEIQSDQQSADLYQAEPSTNPFDIQHNVPESTTFTASLDINPQAATQQTEYNPLSNRRKGFKAEMQAEDLFNFLLTYDGGCKSVEMACPFGGLPLPSTTITYKSSKGRDVKMEFSHRLCHEILKNVRASVTEEDLGLPHVL